KRDELSSAPDVLVQINNFRTINDMKLKVQKTDIYIKPDIKDYSVVSFDEGSKIIENGKQAAHLKLRDLKKLVHSGNFNNSPKIKITHQDSLTINNIVINGNK